MLYNAVHYNIMKFTLSKPTIYVLYRVYALYTSVKCVIIHIETSIRRKFRNKTSKKKGGRKL